MEECGYKPCTRRTRDSEPKIRNELSEEEAVLVPFPRSVLAVNFSRPRSIVGNGGYKERTRDVINRL